MDWSQMVSLVSDIALPIFTGGLVFATICLWRSTSRYAKATKEMAQSTENSLKMQRLDFYERLYFRFKPGLEDAGDGGAVRKFYEDDLNVTTEEEVFALYKYFLKTELDGIRLPDDAK